MAAFNLLTVSICTGIFVCEYRDEFKRLRNPEV